MTDTRVAFHFRSDMGTQDWLAFTALVPSVLANGERCQKCHVTRARRRVIPLHLQVIDLFSQIDKSRNLLRANVALKKKKRRTRIEVL